MNDSQKTAMHGRVRRQRRRKHLFIFISCLIVIFAGYKVIKGTTGLGKLVYGMIGSDESNINETETSNASGIANMLNTIIPSMNGDYTERQLLEDDYAGGNLVLVNKNNPWSLPDDSTMISIYDGKSGSYYVKDKNVELNTEALAHLNSMMDDYVISTGYTDVNVVSGYRSYADQETLYSSSIDEHGMEHTSRYTAMPGCSEHHTGLALDFALFYVDSGASGDFEGSDESTWILNNCWKYGFVKRYNSEKESITGVADEPWHFRYVGVPHAYYMTQNNLCLEEYLEVLKDTSWDGKHMKIDCPDGNNYEVYYCPGTLIHVPSTDNYTVSGNNSDGFIITVEK